MASFQWKFILKNKSSLKINHYEFGLLQPIENPIEKGKKQ